VAGLLASLCPTLTAGAPSGLKTDVTFSDYPRLAEASRLIDRLASPLTAREIERSLSASGKSLDEHTLALSAEVFTLHVPPRPPPGGYGLLVFVPPWNDARLPAGWDAVLDRFGVIFVSAAGSGNDANVLARREPLALIAARNLARLYPINPAHVYVGGFSGGAHVALRLALAYPDVFTGAILDAGADPIGDHDAPIPSPELFARFQSATRLFLVTGSQDQARLNMDTDSLSSLARWCVGGAVADQIANAGHQIADPATLATALRVLQLPVKIAARRQAACRAGIDKDLAKAFSGVEAFAAAGRLAEARKALIALDARFGGLAAPKSVELANALRVQ
jgi:predicted esterase